MQAEDRAAEERLRPDRVAARENQFQAHQGKINVGGPAAVDLRLPLPINDVVLRHTKWLMQKLYRAKERNGDIIFVFKRAKADIAIIPVPIHQGAAAAQND